MGDLNTALANFAITCEARQRMALERAAEIDRTVPAAIGEEWSEYTRVNRDRPMAEARAEAAAWQRRAAEARRGYLLCDPGDLRFQYENQHLHEECATASRIIYEAPVADPGRPLPPG